MKSFLNPSVAIKTKIKVKILSKTSYKLNLIAIRSASKRDVHYAPTIRNS